MERKTILYLGISLDEYLADRDGGVAWLEGPGDPDFLHTHCDNFLKTIDTIVMGNTTYRQIAEELSPGNWPYAGLKSYVFTNRPRAGNSEITFVNSSLPDFVKKLKQERGGSIWIMGGADIANQLIKETLIDELQLSILPVLLGGGIPLFASDNPMLPLKLEHLTENNGVIIATYMFE